MQEFKRVADMMQDIIPQVLTIEDQNVFFCMIASLVDEYAIRKNVSDEDVITFYTEVAKVRPAVQIAMGKRG